MRGRPTIKTVFSILFDLLLTLTLTIVSSVTWMRMDGAEKAMRSLLALQLGLATGLLFSTAIRAVAWWKKFLEDRASKRDEVMRHSALHCDSASTQTSDEELDKLEKGLLAHYGTLPLQPAKSPRTPHHSSMHPRTRTRSVPVCFSTGMPLCVAERKDSGFEDVSQGIDFLKEGEVLRIGHGEKGLGRLVESPVGMDEEDRPESVLEQPHMTPDDLTAGDEKSGGEKCLLRSEMMEINVTAGPQRIRYERDFLLSLQKRATDMTGILPEVKGVTLFRKREAAMTNVPPAVDAEKTNLVDTALPPLPNKVQQPQMPKRSKKQDLQQPLPSQKPTHTEKTRSPTPNNIPKPSTQRTAMHGPDGCPLLTLPRTFSNFRTDSATPIQIPHRTWESASTFSATPNEFSVMTWNILAPQYCTKEKFPGLDDQWRDWEYRKEKLLDEVAYYGADIICLQEITEGDFSTYFAPHLHTLGYRGIFRAKPRSLPTTPPPTKPPSPDGCALFYSTNTFKLLTCATFSYPELTAHLSVPTTPDIIQDLLRFPNVLITVLLQNVKTRQKVRIVNTHLHWNPAQERTKLLQAVLLMEFMKSFEGIGKRDNGKGNSVPVIVAGDLNSMKGERVMRFLEDGIVDVGGEWGWVGKDYGRLSAPGSTAMATTVTNPLPLKTAYTNPLPYTNKTRTFTGAIDHILYTPSALVVKDVLGPVVGYWMDGVHSLPSASWPSDHVGLCVWIGWKSENESVKGNGNGNGARRRAKKRGKAKAAADASVTAPAATPSPRSSVPLARPTVQLKASTPRISPPKQRHRTTIVEISDQQSTSQARANRNRQGRERPLGAVACM